MYKRQEINKSKLQDGKYKLSIVLSSSVKGAYFKGAVGSTLYVDELELISEEKMCIRDSPWGDLGLNLRLKLSKNYTFSMSSSFKTYGYKFDKNEMCIRDSF